MSLGESFGTAGKSPQTFPTTKRAVQKVTKQNNDFFLRRLFVKSSQKGPLCDACRTAPFCAPLKVTLAPSVGVGACGSDRPTIDNDVAVALEDEDVIAFVPMDAARSHCGTIAIVVDERVVVPLHGQQGIVIAPSVGAGRRATHHGVRLTAPRT